MWIADNWKDYEVLDTSGGEKLERWGDYILVRPDPQVIWESQKENPGWHKMNGHYHRSGKGGGDCLVLGAAGFFQTFNHIRFSCNYSGLSSDAVSSDASVSAAGAAAFAKRFGSYALPLA